MPTAADESAALAVGFQGAPDLENYDYGYGDDAEDIQFAFNYTSIQRHYRAGHDWGDYNPQGFRNPR